MRARLRRGTDRPFHRHHLVGGRGHGGGGLVGRGRQLTKFVGGQHPAPLHHAEQRKQAAFRGSQCGHRLAGGRAPRRKSTSGARSRRRQRLTSQPAVAQERQRRQEGRADRDGGRDEQRPERGLPRRQQAGHADPEHRRHREEHAEPQRPASLTQQLGARIRCGVELFGHHIGPLCRGVHTALRQRAPGLRSTASRFHRCSSQKLLRQRVFRCRLGIGCRRRGRGGCRATGGQLLTAHRRADLLEP